MKKREIKDIHKNICGNIATCKENGRVFVLKKANDFYKVRIDNDVVPKGEEPRCCDYYFFKEDEIEIFVELKGRNTEDAFSQLEQSINDFSYGYPKKYAFIISAKSPKMTTEIQKYMNLFKKRQFDLKIKTNRLECSYNRDSKDIEKIK
ncbi:MAG: hypothetical protein Q4A56_02100 [Porphyromonadaceae bacterium]|nr:hypothetical protein [Porphyromonadaceae bacterium]